MTIRLVSKRVQRFSQLPLAGLLALAAAALWPVIELSGGLLARRHSLLQVVILRYATHLAIAGAIFLPRHGLPAFRTRRPGLQLLRGLCMRGMPMGFVLGVGSHSADGIWAGFWTYPFLVLAGAAVLLGERPAPTRWIAATVGLAGALLWLRPGTDAATAAPYGLLMATTFATYIVVSRELRDEPLSASLAYTALGALLPLTIVIPRIWTPLVAADIPAMLGLGIASLLFLGCIDRATELADAGALAIWLFAAAPAEAVLRGGFHGIVTVVTAVLGMALIAIAIRMTWRGSTADPAHAPEVAA